MTKNNNNENKNRERELLARTGIIQPETEGEGSTSVRSLILKNWEKEQLERKDRINHNFIKIRENKQKLAKYYEECRKGLREWDEEYEYRLEEEQYGYYTEASRLEQRNEVLNCKKRIWEEKKRNREEVNISENFDLFLSQTEVTTKALTLEQKKKIQAVEPKYRTRTYTKREMISYEKVDKLYPWGSEEEWEEIMGDVEYSEDYETKWYAKDVKEVLRKGFQASNEQWIEIRKNLLIMKEKYEDEKEAVLAEIKKKDETIEENEKKVKRLEKEREEAELQAQKIFRKLENSEKEKKEQEISFQSEISQQKKLLESKEQVAVRNLAEIQAEYNVLVETSQSQGETIEGSKKAITELIALINKLEQEKKILILERNAVFAKWDTTRTERDKLIVGEGIAEANIRSLKNEILNREDKIENNKKEINRWINAAAVLDDRMKEARKERDANEKELREAKKTIDGYVATIEEQKKTIEKLEQKKQRLENQLSQLESQKTDLQQQLTDKEQELNQAIAAKLQAEREAKWAHFGSAVQGITENLFGEKWGKRTNTAIQFASGARLASQIGSWGYEIWIAVMTIALFFVGKVFAKRVLPIAKKVINKQLGITEPQEIKVVVVNSQQPEQTNKEKKEPETTKETEQEPDQEQEKEP